MSRPRFQPYMSKELDPCSAFCIIYNHPKKYFLLSFLLLLLSSSDSRALRFFIFPSHTLSFSLSLFLTLPRFLLFFFPFNLSILFSTFVILRKVGNESRQSIHFPHSSAILTFFFQLFILYKKLDRLISTI